MDVWIQGRGMGRLGRLGLTYIHHHVKQMASGKLLYSTGAELSALRGPREGHWGPGGRFRREGTYVCM